MIQFQFDLQLPKIDVKNIQKKFFAFVEEQYKIAAKKFLVAALAKIPLTEYSTGFTAYAFLNLADLIGVTASKFGPALKGLTPAKQKKFRNLKEAAHRRLFGQRPPLFPTTRTLRLKQGGRNLRIKINPFYYGAGTKVLRTPENAREFSTPINEIFHISKNGTLEISFFYEIDIDYFNIQEAQNIKRSKSAPWQAFEAGRKAFIDHLNKVDFQDEFDRIFDNLVKSSRYTVSFDGAIRINRET